MKYKCAYCGSENLKDLELDEGYVSTISKDLTVKKKFLCNDCNEMSQAYIVGEVDIMFNSKCDKEGLALPGNDVIYRNPRRR